MSGQFFLRISLQSWKNPSLRGNPFVRSLNVTKPKPQMRPPLNSPSYLMPSDRRKIPLPWNHPCMNSPSYLHWETGTKDKWTEWASLQHFLILWTVGEVHDAQTTANTVHKGSVLKCKNVSNELNKWGGRKLGKIKIYHSECHLATASGPFHVSAPFRSSLRCSECHRHSDNRQSSPLPIVLKWEAIHHLTSSPIIVAFHTNLPSSHTANSKMKIQIYGKQNFAPERETETCLGSLNWITLRSFTKLSFSLCLLKLFACFMCFHFTRLRCRKAVQLTTTQTRIVRWNEKRAKETEKRHTWT